MRINIFWLFTILWICTIFYFSSRPAEVSRRQSGEILAKADIIQDSEVDTSVARNARESYVLRMQNKIRKYAHVTEYFILGTLMTLSLTFRQKLKIYKILTGLLACLAVSSMDEFFQRYVPGRGPSVKDVLTDAKGFSTGIAVVAAIMLIAALVRKNKDLEAAK